jgi:RimJ/RimL family protein N-acetyltransferase
MMTGGDVLLATERLVLRQFTMSDVENLATLDSDPEVMRFITGGLATSREEIADSLLPGLMAWYRRPGRYGCWAAEERSTGAFAGWFRFHPRPAGPPGEIVLGFRFRRPAWGKGYATEGSCALVRKGFTELGAERVVAETMAINLASRRVLEKAGLSVVRVFRRPWPHRVDGREFGDVEYALSKDEWEQRNQITAVSH